MKITENGIILGDNGTPLLISGKVVQKAFTGTTTTTTTQGTTTTTTAGTSTTTTTSAGGSAGGDVVLEFTFDQAPSSATTNILKTKYGKKLIYNFEIDDNPKHAAYFLAYFQGGVCGIDNQFYPGKTFTDGCGNNVKWRYSVACNVKNHYNDNFLMDPINGYNSINLDEVKMLNAAGCICVPHGYYHFDDPNAPLPNGYVSNGFTKSTNLSECEKYLWQNGNGFKARYMVIPQDSQGYNVPLKAQGLYAQSSAGIMDGEYDFTNTPEEFQYGLIYLDEVIGVYNTIGYAGFRRAYLYDWNDTTNQINPHLNAINYALSRATENSPTMQRAFTHGVDGVNWNGAKSFFDQLQANCGDDIWVTHLQEVLDYLETRRLVQKTETLVGNKLTVKLNYNQIPDDNFWRDLSMKVSAVGATLTGVTVKGAQGSSFNLSTGLVNVFNVRKALVYPYSQNVAGGGTLSNGVIPYDPKHDIYLDNNQFYQDYSKLRDGDLLTNYLASENPNLIYPNHDMVIMLSRFKAKVSRVTISFGNGAGGFTQTDIILVEKNGTEHVIGTWTQNGYQQTDTFWVDPANHTESSYVVDRIILRAKTNVSYGAEVLAYGTYQPPLTHPYKKVRTPIGYQAGWNIHPWYLSRNDPPSIVQGRVDAILNMDMILGSLRCYDDGYAVQDADGKWRIGTEIRGFVMDQAYAYFKQQEPGMVKWRCLQNQSLIISATWDRSFADTYIQGTVANYQDNIGWGGLTLHVTSIQGSGFYTRWHIYSGANKVDGADFGYSVDSNLIGQNLYFNVGGQKGYTVGQVLQLRRSQTSHVWVPLPADGNLLKDAFPIYDSVSEAAFVYASRLGKNPNVPDYPCVIDANNSMTKGTDLCDIFEFGNEWNAYWTSWYGYWNGHSLFYAMSMCYDGHMNQYANRGVRQADPNAKMAISGLAADKLDIPYAYLEQTIKFRGKNPDGTWNVPFDIINIHMYSSAGGQYSGSKGGLPPEQGMLPQIKNLVWFIETYLPTKEVWISEWGWDVNQGSPLAALIYGPYTDGRFVAAMWHARAMLLMAKEGIDRAQCYRLYQDGNWDDNNSGQFATMAGLRTAYDNDDWNAPVSRTPVGDYFKQLQEFARYAFDKEISTGLTGVYCYQYIDQFGKRIIALWAEESTVMVNNVPTFTERTGTFNVPVPTNGTVKIRTFVNDGSGVMAQSQVTAIGSTIGVGYNAVPKIIELNPTLSLQQPIMLPRPKIQLQLPAPSQSSKATVVEDIEWSLRINERETDENGFPKLSGGMYNTNQAVLNILNDRFDLVRPFNEDMLMGLARRSAERAGFKMELIEKGSGKRCTVSLWSRKKLEYERSDEAEKLNFYR